MRKNNKALYEQIMRNISREVKRVLNEQDYYADNVDYAVTNTDDITTDNVDYKQTLLTQVEPTNKDEIRLKQWEKYSESPKMKRMVINAIYGINDINKLIKRWAMAIMLNMTKHRFFNDLEKRVLTKTNFTKGDYDTARAYWKRLGQKKYPEYWS